MEMAGRREVRYEDEDTKRSASTEEQLHWTPMSTFMAYLTSSVPVGTTTQNNQYQDKGRYANQVMENAKQNLNA